MKDWNQSKRSVTGGVVERNARQYLVYLGLCMVSPISDRWRPVRKDKSGLWLCQKQGGKLHGDIWAVYPETGQLVICECKHSEDSSLSLSQFMEHQRESLDNARRCKAIPLVFWQIPGGVFVLPWPVPDLAKGRPMKPAEAALHNITTASRLADVAGQCKGASNGHRTSKVNARRRR